MVEGSKEVEWNNNRDKVFGKWLARTPSLAGKNVAITGTTSGTGFYTAVFAIRKNAKLVILLNRKSTKNDDSMKLLLEEKEKVGSVTEVRFVACDLMSFESVEAAAEEVPKVCDEFGGYLNVLANNAGIMAFPDDRTKDGFDVQMQTNHLSHYVMTKMLMPLFEATLQRGQEVRIVQHSSGARTGFTKNFLLEEKYFKKCEANTLGGKAFGTRFTRYCETKLANTTFALMLHKKLLEKGFDTKMIKSVVAEPGVAATDLGNNTVKSTTWGGFLKGCVLGAFMAIIRPQSAADGATPLIEACFGENVDSGDFFHPEKTSHGKPLKAINKGVLTKAGSKSNKEIATLNEKNQELVWRMSEEVCGPFFG